MLDYGALAALAAIVREGSFEKAAAQLHVTPSAVSQRLKQLEERTGSILVRRGQPCEGTEEGLLLCRHFEAVQLMERDLADSLPGVPRPHGPVTIPIAVNADSLDSWFIKAVSKHIVQTGILVDFKVDDQDHTAEWLRRGEVLAAVTSVENPVQGCQVMRIGKLSYRATATPDYMARHFPDGVSEAAVKVAPALTFGQKDRLQTQWLEKRFGADVPRHAHWLPSTQGFVTACLMGFGWGLNPLQLVEGHLAAGDLVELEPGLSVDIPLFWQVSRRASSILDGLSTSIVDAGRKWLQ